MGGKWQPNDCGIMEEWSERFSAFVAARTSVLK